MVIEGKETIKTPPENELGELGIRKALTLAHKQTINIRTISNATVSKRTCFKKLLMVASNIS